MTASPSRGAGNNGRKARDYNTTADAAPPQINAQKKFSPALPDFTARPRANR